MEKEKSMTKQETEEMMKQLEKVFSIVRILDVEGLETANSLNKGKMPDHPCQCYSFWNRDTRCANCISARVLADKKQRTKIEFIDSDMYQVISRYIEIDNVPHIIEMINCLDSDTLIDSDGRKELIGKIAGFDKEIYLDVLTGAYNRKYYEDNVKMSTRVSGIAMLDIDDFKLYNDIYGHDMGDQVLCIVADVIKDCIRKTDKLIRYGGDEFLLILSDMVRGTLRGKLLQIQEAIENATIPNCSRLKLTASIGGVISEDGQIDEAIAKADQLMYKAKDHKAQVITECDKTIFKKEKIQNKPRILIVDDSEFNRAILKEILEETYEIIEADGGNEALHKIDEYGMKISLVLLDIIMPEKDGFEVLKYMEEERLISDIPVIIISSEDSANYIRRAYEMGVSDYINRPFDANIVYQRVSNTVKLYAKQRRLMAMVTRV